MNLRLDWCSHEAAKYACENYHYSRATPTNKLVKIGVWESDRFIGVILFGTGASAQVHKQFGVTQFQICELVRVALRDHVTPVTRLISIAIKMLRKRCPKLRVIVSFADTAQNHHGGIYQGGNWVYTGRSASTTQYWFQGSWRHRTNFTGIGIKGLKTRKSPPKHRYVMPLDAEIRLLVEQNKKPYPKRAGSKDIVASSDQDEEGGENPTPALHHKI